ncbi:MAG TPA: Calx-beta domain-containing protein [Solirubrobacteraceae bacterium]
MLCALLGGVLVLAAPAAAQAAIAVDDVRVTEGDGGVTATFTITRSAPLLARATTVAFETVDATARAPADYLATSGTLTFPGALLGATQTQQVAVAIAGDRLDEPNESFRLILGGSEVADGEGIGTIVDDDPQPAIGVADAAAATEGGAASFVVALSAPSGRDVSVSFATVNGSAVAGEDYTAHSGRLTIPPGTTAATVPVALLDDTADEPPETFGLRLSAPGAATLAQAAATATILDNDPPPVQTSGAPGQPPPNTGSSPSPAAAAPRLGLGSPRLRRPTTALVTIACPQEAGSCSGRLTLFSRASKRSQIQELRRERRLGERRFTLDGGRTQTLEITLRRRDRGLLARAGRMRVRAFAVTQDASGRTGVRTVNGTLLWRTAHSSPSARR